MANVKGNGKRQTANRVFAFVFAFVFDFDVAFVVRRRQLPFATCHLPRRYQLTFGAQMRSILQSTAPPGRLELRGILRFGVL